MPNLIQENDMCSVVVFEPHYRTLTITGYNKYNKKWIAEPIRLPLPYLVFIISYSHVPGGWLYSGVFGGGLRVLFKNNLDLYKSPTEYCGSGGLSCTDHSWDYTVFDTKEELIATIIDLWFSTSHQIVKNTIDIATWKNLTIEEILKIEWTEPVSIKIKTNTNKIIKLTKSALQRGPHGRPKISR